MDSEGPNTWRETQIGATMLFKIISQVTWRRVADSDLRFPLRTTTASTRTFTQKT